MSTMLQNLCHNFSGPLIFDYVWWILTQAQNRKIHTLYFLARDGFILREIAQCFCHNFNLDIDCRYLYCSRASLRMPSYHLIGDEAYDLFIAWRISYYAVFPLQRADLAEDQRKTVYKECGLCEANEQRFLNRAEMENTREKLRNSAVYKKLLLEKSGFAYHDTIEYMRQEGLMDKSDVAIVDSGWTGSMQRSLRQLLQSDGFTGKITGFYFGMYAEPKEIDDGTYLTWHFNYSGKILDKIPFCNNLFECLLAAPHGMTRGYVLQNNKYIPVLDESQNEQQLRCIKENINVILDYTKLRLENIAFSDFQENQLKKDTKERIVRYMAHPTSEEAAFYGAFLFCDDVTEAYHLKLADSSQIKALKGYSLHTRVLRRLFRLRAKEEAPELLWVYGTIAFLPKLKQHWYRFNVCLWEWIRYYLS